MFDNHYEIHQYYLFSTGTVLKDKCFNTRKDAEKAMYKYCAKNGIKIECSECDKHERVYQGSHGETFYINRI